MSFEEMKQQLIEEGDYSKAEVEAMSMGEVLTAWASLPPIWR